MANDRNFQLQGIYTRYYDGLHSVYGTDHRRNFKTLEGAIKAAKKALKCNELPKVASVSYDRNDFGRVIETHLFAEDGHELHWSKDKPQFWHVDHMRVVDRETQKVLWEA